MKSERIKQMSLCEYEIGYALGQAKILTNSFPSDAPSEEIKIQAIQEIIKFHLICVETMNREITLLTNELHEIMDVYNIAILFAGIDHLLRQQGQKIDAWESSPWKEDDYFSFLRLKNAFLIEHCEKLYEKLSMIKNVIFN